MDDNLLSNFASAWGQEEPQGLNPGYLPDLLAMSESHLEQGVERFRTLFPHFESMRERLMIAQNTMTSLIGRRDSIPEDLYESALENKHCFHDAELAIEELLGLSAEDSSDTYWDTLGQIEEASANLEAATQELARVAREHQ